MIRNRFGLFASVLCLSLIYGYVESPADQPAVQNSGKGAVERALAAPVSFTWGDIKAGDCEMQAGMTLTLYPSGWGEMKAQVMTHHTHSGDTWHISFTGYNSSNGVVLTIPILGSMDSMRMDDNHGYYGWTQDFTFDPIHLGEVDHMISHSSC
jgi:hypothetical protein